MAVWTTTKTVVLLIPAGLAVLAVVLAFALRKTFRTRQAMEAQLRKDPDIDDWLVVFNWSRKILYLPTILVSLVAAGLSFFFPQWPAEQHYVIGGVWLAVFFLNFLVDEYEMSLKVLIIIVLCLLVLGLWLSLLDWLVPFLEVFKKLHVSLNATAYLIFALILAMAVGVSWLHGLFYYVAFTPNFMNIQTGPTESGEQVAREEYSTRIDTGDFLERVLGFGRVIVTFKDQRRQPLVLLVGRVGSKVAKLDSIRAKIAIDRRQEPAAGA